VPFKTTKEIHYISSLQGLTAVYIKQSNTTQMYYIHKDHLGSITALTNEQGEVAERYAYDAWGRPRNA
jgi:uncharacterized protein RhaS with RHS repeats